MATCSESKALLPSQVKLEIERVDERVFGVRLRLGDLFRGDKILQDRFENDGLELLTAFSLVKGVFYHQGAYSSHTQPLSRDFQANFGVLTVLEETSIGLLLDEVSPVIHEKRR